jgi:large subunit ribosomal protein L9
MAQEVILMEDVEGLGITGDIVRVAPGYARNYLFPQNKAAQVTDATRRMVEKRRAEADRKRAETRAAAQALADKIGAMALAITARAGSDGKLYGSIGMTDLLDALKKEGVELQKSQVDLREPFRQLGDYTVKVRLLSDIHAELKIQIKE